VGFSHPIFLFFAALLAGLLNAVAGGGSFISFPALLFSGIAPIAANATNTAAVWPGTVASTIAYRKEFTAEARRLLPPLLVTGILGGIIGARVLLSTPQSTFMRIVPWLLLGATLLFASSGWLTARLHARLGTRREAQTNENAASGGSVGSAGSLSDAPQGERKTPRALLVVGLFLELLVAIYIGYFGAGVGILLLALLAFLGMENIHTMNGMKSLLVSVVNGVALVTFIFARVIVWPQALLMLVGAMLGGYAGAHYSRKMSQQHIRWLVIVVGFGMSAYFFIHR
jgi:uncharacterized membrane protein YfcA